MVAAGFGGGILSNWRFGLVRSRFAGCSCRLLAAATCVALRPRHHRRRRFRFFLFAQVYVQDHHPWESDAEIDFFIITSANVVEIFFSTILRVFIIVEGFSLIFSTFRLARVR